MNELIGSFAGKRLAAFGALIAAIALLAAGGALSTGAAQAQTPTASTGTGLDHISAGNTSIDAVSVSLAVGTRHHVCLMTDVTHQQFRPDSANDDGTPPAEPEPADGSGDCGAGAVDCDGANYNEANDVDDFDWPVLRDQNGNPIVRVAPGTSHYLDHVELGPTGILTTRPSGAAASPLGEASTTGWNWVIQTTAGTGSPTISNPSRTFPNMGAAGEACVFWTSTAPGTQTIRLYMDTYLVANDVMFDQRWWDFDSPPPELSVTWVDSDPLIRISRATGATRNGLPVTAAVSAPIDQRMVFTGAGVAAVAASDGPDGVAGTDDDIAGDPGIPAQSFQPAPAAGGSTPATVVLEVEAVQSALQAQALTGASVSFAVTGDCGMVNVPGAVVGTDRTSGNVRPGQTGVVGSWPSTNLSVVFSNTGTGGAACKLSSSSTTLEVTSGSATNTVTVNWNWDGYGIFTMDDVDDTTKRVTFHSAVPRTYNALGQAVGWACEDASQARTLTYDVDGRATVVGASRSETVTIGAGGVVSPTSQGRATPQRTLAAMDTECQFSWTVRSPSRAADVYVDISTVGVDAYSQVLNFAPEAPAITTFDDLEAPLVPGNSQVIWTGGSTAVADAIGDSGATAVYLWVNATQSWLAFFPGQEGLGVNSLTMLSNGDILFVSTPSN